MAVAGGLPGGARDVPVGARPDGRVPRLRLHLRLVAASSQWVEEHDPELFERIRARIAEGRWQVVGGWWVEPDCNIPGGESFVRQALYGQRYLHDTFGITATTGANVDSFGHNATIPQILRKSGMDSYVFLRPGPHENATLPAPLFWWEAPDGSRVLAYRIPHEYCAPHGRHRRARREGARVAAGRRATS